MQIVDDVLQDWHACKPDGVVLRAERVSCVIERIVSAIDDSNVGAPLRQQAFKLLTPANDASTMHGGLPPVVRQLSVDSSYRFADTQPASAVGRQHKRGGAGAVIHFVCFWKAVGEVRRRLSPPEDIDNEPIAEEIEAFRDALLRDARDDVLTRASFSARVTDAKALSEDPSAWASLEGTAVAMATDTGAAGESGLLMEQISVLLLTWLAEVVEDYLRGSRFAEIKTVRDVLRCPLHAACDHLSKNNWDVEAALRSYYSRGPPLVATAAAQVSGAWGSQSAKLRSDELECPICFKDFDHGTESVATRCCFQVLCVHCVSSLTDHDGVLPCPFCRRLEARAAPVENTVGDFAIAAALGDESATDALVGSILHAAGKCAQDFRGLLGFMAPSVSARPQQAVDVANYRLDVALPRFSLDSMGVQ